MGTDWRDTSKKVLEELQTIQVKDDDFSLGFIYISDHLAEDAGSILNLFQSVTGLENWIGCVGVGILANGQTSFDTPAIAAMLTRIPEESFAIPPCNDFDTQGDSHYFSSWINENEPFCMIAHGSPASAPDPLTQLEDLHKNTGSFIVGGLSSSRTDHVQFAGGVIEEGLCGVVFNDDVQILTGLSQGCKPIGPKRRITRAHDNMVLEIDKQRAFDVFIKDVQSYRQNFPSLTKGQGGIKDTTQLAQDSLFYGDIHVAFPVRGSDLQDYTVRNISELNPDQGSISLSTPFIEQEEICLVLRDPSSRDEDLSKMLLRMRQRFHKQFGHFQPKGALYISCVARADQNQLSGLSQESDHFRENDEMKLINEIIGDIPIIGFYASGEISNARLYGYTGILILFN